MRRERVPNFVPRLSLDFPNTEKAPGSSNPAGNIAYPTIFNINDDVILGENTTANAMVPTSIVGSEVIRGKEGPRSLSLYHHCLHPEQ